jgi:hypothetical protein
VFQEKSAIIRENFSKGELHQYNQKGLIAEVEHLKRNDGTAVKERELLYIS